MPALVADGLTLPFENLVDWSYAAVWIEEAVARNATTHPDPAAYLRSYFPSGPVVEQMRTNVNNIGETLMKDEESIITALLMAAAEFAKNRQVRPRVLWTDPPLPPVQTTRATTRSRPPSHPPPPLYPAHPPPPHRVPAALL